MKTQTWFLYLLECVNGSIYTGITNDVAARFAAHVAGTGAKYTRANRPLRVLKSFECENRSAASKAEYAVKKLSAAKKRLLCKQDTLPNFI